VIRNLLDTNAVGDWMNRRYGVDVRAREAKQSGALLGTCEPVVAELYFGVENSASRDMNLILLQRSLPGLKCWPLSRSASKEFGRLMTTLKRLGQTIGPIDALIASIALSLSDCVVISNDSDMRRIPGLRVENWRESND